MEKLQFVKQHPDDTDEEDILINLHSILKVRLSDDGGNAEVQLPNEEWIRVYITYDKLLSNIEILR